MMLMVLRRMRRGMAAKSPNRARNEGECYGPTECMHGEAPVPAGVYREDELRMDIQNLHL